MNTALIFSLALVLLGVVSQVPIITFANKNKGKQNYRNTLLMSIYTIIIHGLVILLNFIGDYEQFVLVWGLIYSVFVFNIGRNYINTKELTNIEIELKNRIYIPLPTGMTVYIALFNLNNEVEIILFIVLPVAMIIGIITMVMNYRRLNTIRTETHAIFWKRIHYCNSVFMILVSLFSMHVVVNNDLLTDSMVLSSILIFTDLITLIALSIKKGGTK